MYGKVALSTVTGLGNPVGTKRVLPADVKLTVCPPPLPSKCTLILASLPLVGQSARVSVTLAFIVKV